MREVNCREQVTILGCGGFVHHYHTHGLAVPDPVGEEREQPMSDITEIRTDTQLARVLKNEVKWHFEETCVLIM